MEIVDNTALKLLVPTDIVPYITNNIERSEVLNTNGNLTEMLVYWGIDELTHLNRLVSFRKSLPSPIRNEIGRAHV